MTILYRYLFGEILAAMLTSSAVLTLVLVLFNVYQRVFDLIVNNDMPVLLVFYMVLLLFPQALTFTLPWSLLIAVLLVFGRMSRNNELVAIRSAGLGLVPFIAPVVLLSLGMTMVCFFNNAWLAPWAITQFKIEAINLARNNPTVFLRTQEPIDKFDGFRLFIGRKSGNTIEDIHIWALNDEGLPKQSMRADRGIIKPDLGNKIINLTLYNVRQEVRSNDPTRINDIQVGIRAMQLPRPIPLDDFLDTSQITRKESHMIIGDLWSSALSPDDARSVSLLTEMQKRLSFSFAAFTFVLVGIPLAITAQRSETSVGFVMSLAIAVGYYVMILGAETLKNHAPAFPELMVWLPNILFQILGFWLLYKVNKSPA